MDTVMETLFGLVGGLSLFLFGMNMMSDGLQKVAGKKMKKILSMLTTNRIIGCLAGALVTAVLQSSSATTVLVIGFVGSGLMTLPQGIAVIFGANIGTTMTAQLLAFKISDYIYIIVAIGFFMWFAFKKNKTVHNVGQVIFAFGLLFVGIETMGDVMKPLASSDVFLNMIEYVKDIPALGVLVGTLMTVVVQSSSATIAVLQNFASQAAADGTSSVLGLEGAIPILLGDNIGTTITALIACIGQSRDAKRVAVSHATFNICGALVFIWFVPQLAALVQWITPGVEVEVISRQIANAHTIYNTLNTVIWLILLPVMVKIVYFIVPDRGEGSGAVVSLDSRIVAQPAFAINMLTDQLARYCGKVGDVINELELAIQNRDAKMLVTIKDDVSRVDNAKDELNEFMVELLAAGSVTEEQAEETSNLMILAESVGNVSDRCGEIADVYSRKVSAKEGKGFSEGANKDLVDSAAMLSQMYNGVLEYLSTEGDEAVEELNETRRKVIKKQSKVRKNHFKRISNKECLPGNREDFDAMLLGFERASNECFNLIEHGADLTVIRELPENEKTPAAEETDSAPENA